MIAGHHAGLADWYDNKGSLKRRLQQADDELAALCRAWRSGLPKDFSRYPMMT